jgi:hypothetical protein
MDQLDVSDRDICVRAKLSRRTLHRLRSSGGSTEDATCILQAAEAIRKERVDAARVGAEILTFANAVADDLGGPAALAKRLGMTRQYVGRILKGERPVSEAFTDAVRRLRREM